MISQRLQRALALCLALFGTLACALTLPQDANTVPQQTPDTAAGPPAITLAAPLDGAAYAPDVPVNILARVTNAGEDIDRVDVLVDDAVVLSVAQPNPAGAPVFPLAQTWMASGSGARTLAVVVYRADGTASEPATRTITVEGDAPVTGAAGDGAATTSGGNPAGGGGLLGNLFGGLGGATGGEAAPTVEAQAPAAEEAQAAPPAAAEVDPTPPPDPTAAPTEAPSATPNTPTAVTTAGVNVRAGPGTAFAAIGGGYTAGTETELLAVNSDRTWYKVRYFNGEGWIAASLLEVRNADNLPIDNGPPPPTPTATPVPATEAPTQAASNRNIAFDGAQGFEPFPPDCGQTMAITLRLRNTGSESLGTTSAAIVRDIHPDSGTVTETIIPVPDIDAGETIEVTGGFLTVETNFGAQHRIEIELDANDEITEADEGDNVFSGGLEYTLDQGSC